MMSKVTLLTYIEISTTSAVLFILKVVEALMAFTILLAFSLIIGWSSLTHRKLNRGISRFRKLLCKLFSVTIKLDPRILCNNCRSNRSFLKWYSFVIRISARILVSVASSLFSWSGLWSRMSPWFGVFSIHFRSWLLGGGTTVSNRYESWGCQPAP